MPNVIRQFLSFLSVGVLATACHYAMMIALVESEILGPVIAATIGATIGAIVSYGLNRTKTFRSERPHTEAAPRFFLIAAFAVFINAALMALFTKMAGLPYIFAQIIATGIIVLLTFSGNKFWTFNTDS